MSKVKIFYYYPKNNFGDQLNLYLLDKLFKKEYEFKHPNNANLIMIGSVLEPLILKNDSYKNLFKKIIYPKLNIYGSGFISNQKLVHEKYIRKLNIHSLRGKLTRDRLSYNLNLNLNDICLGDPGLLVSKLNNVEVDKQYSVGIIPHMINLDDNRVEQLNELITNSIIINPLDRVEEIIQKISKCEIILSNAMHGLIVADSLGIPNKRLILNKELFGGDYKFMDYYSAFDMNLPDPLILNNLSSKDIINNINKIKFNYNLNYDKIVEIQERLLKSIPDILKK